MRQLRGLPRLTVEEHAIVRIAGPLRALPAYFVDNVITTGATLTACRRALGWGTGLAFAAVSKLYHGKTYSHVESKPTVTFREDAMPYESVTARAARPLA